MARVPKKAHTKKLCNLHKKHGGMYTTRNTKDCRKYEKNGLEKANYHAAKKDGMKPNHAKNSFVQMSKKLEELEKAIKKQCAPNQRNVVETITISTQNRELGWVA
jgi:hypothetical protein